MNVKQSSVTVLGLGESPPERPSVLVDLAPKDKDWDVSEHTDGYTVFVRLWDDLNDRLFSAHKLAREHGGLRVYLREGLIGG